MLTVLYFVLKLWENICWWGFLVWFCVQQRSRVSCVRTYFACSQWEYVGLEDTCNSVHCVLCLPREHGTWALILRGTHFYGHGIAWNVEAGTSFSQQGTARPRCHRNVSQPSSQGHRLAVADYHSYFYCTRIALREISTFGVHVKLFTSGSWTQVLNSLSPLRRVVGGGGFLAPQQTRNPHARCC